MSEVNISEAGPVQFPMICACRRALLDADPVDVMFVINGLPVCIDLGGGRRPLPLDHAERVEPKSLMTL